MRFLKKIQDWILKSERNRKRILRFFIRQINPRSFGSWFVKGTEESTSRLDSSVPWTHHDPRDIGLICLRNAKSIFGFFSDLRIQSWISLKKRTLSLGRSGNSKIPDRLGFSRHMKTRLYDSAYDSDFRFSRLRLRQYDSDSVASENQP